MTWAVFDAWDPGGEALQQGVAQAGTDGDPEQRADQADRQALVRDRAAAWRRLMRFSDRERDLRDP